MKGDVSWLHDIVMLLVQVAVVAVLALFISYVITFLGVTGIGRFSPREVFLQILNKPAEFDSTLLSYLEVTSNGIPMKKIVNAVAIQRSTIVRIDGIPNPIDAKALSEQTLNQMISPNKAYLLKLTSPEIILARRGPLSNQVQKISTKVFLLDGDFVDLELLVDSS